MNKRIIYFDYLKIFANVAVIMIHIISQSWDNLNVYSQDFFNLTLTDSFLRWAVPIFIMISGALFLGTDKDKNIIQFLKKYVLKIYLVFIIWNMIYAVSQGLFIENINIDLGWFLNQLKMTLLGNGLYHLWYLPLIICLYLLTPILNIFINNSKNLLQKYYLIILILFISVLPTLANIFNFGLGFPIRIFGGFILYYLLGYYLANNFEIKKRYSIVCYLLGVGLTFFLTMIFSKLYTFPVENYFDYLSATVLLTCMGIFLFFKSIKFTENKLIKTLGSNSLGIYLVHGLVFGIFSKLNLIPTTNVLYIIIYTVVIYLISFTISYIIRKIPIFRFAI